MRYMLDTNICIYAIKHKPEKAFKRLQEHDPSEICISSVTYAEDDDIYKVLFVFE